MSSRYRQSTTGATPRPGRQGTVGQTPARGTQRGREDRDLPAYEPPVYPLNANAQEALRALIDHRNLTTFQRRMDDAINVLSTNAGDVNDVIRTKGEVVAKDRQRHDREAADDEDDEARVANLEKDLENMKEEVDKMTQRMDTDLRKMLDTKEYFGFFRPVLTEVVNETTAFARQNPTQTQPLTQTQRRRRAREPDDSLDDESEEEEYQDFDPTDPTNAQTQSAPAPPAPATLFKDKLSRKKDRYQNQNDRKRYGTDNDYKNFRTVVHHARFGDEVDVPHEKTWFTNDGVAKLPQPGVTDPNAGNDGEDSDDDLQIVRGRISTKCPITLQEYVEPFSSRKCIHTFEKSAILDMINQGGPSQRAHGGNVPGVRDGDQYVKCPASGCNAFLAAVDMHSDPVITRKIIRIQKANKEAEEDDDDEDEDGDARQGDRGRPHEIESGDDSDGIDIDDLADGDREAKRIKMERASQRTRG